MGGTLRPGLLVWLLPVPSGNPVCLFSGLSLFPLFFLRMSGVAVPSALSSAPPPRVTSVLQSPRPVWSVPPLALLSTLSPPCHVSISQLAHSASWLPCLQSFPTDLFPTHSSPCISKLLPKMLQCSLTPLTNVRAGGQTPPHGTTCRPSPNSLFQPQPHMLFSHSQNGASSHTSLPSFALPPTVLSAWNVHVHLADLENSDSPLNENHSGCFWLQETHTSRTFIFTLQQSGGEWAVSVPERSKDTRDPVLPIVPRGLLSVRTSPPQMAATAPGTAQLAREAGEWGTKGFSAPMLVSCQTGNISQNPPADFL